MPHPSANWPVVSYPGALKFTRTRWQISCLRIYGCNAHFDTATPRLNLHETANIHCCAEWRQLLNCQINDKPFHQCALRTGNRLVLVRRWAPDHDWNHLHFVWPFDWNSTVEHGCRIVDGTPCSNRSEKTKKNWSKPRAVASSDTAGKIHQLFDVFCFYVQLFMHSEDGSK